MDEVGLLVAAATMDVWLWMDAVEHLGEIQGTDWTTDAAKCRSDLMTSILTHNENFGKFVDWQERTIADSITKEIGLKDDQQVNLHAAPDEGGCNVMSLIEYLHRHFYLGEQAELRQLTDQQIPATLPPIVTLEIQYAGNNGRFVIARTTDTLKIARLVGNMDSWGKEYSRMMKQVDEEIIGIKGMLERFHYYLRAIIRTMTYFPQNLKSECSIEKSVSRKV